VRLSQCIKLAQWSPPTVYIILRILYESFIHPLTVLSTLPSAGVGAWRMLGGAAGGKPMSIDAEEAAIRTVIVGGEVGIAPQDVNGVGR